MVEHPNVVYEFLSFPVFEIPDAHAERLLRPADIVRYVADKFDVYE